MNGNIVKNLALIQAKILKASEANASVVRLVAVSKTKPLQDVMIAYEAGQLVFGENYVQELIEKATNAPKDIMWHFIGKVQSNKIKFLTSIPNLVVETIDSIKMADNFNKNWGFDRKLGIFLQVNTSMEEAKNGLLDSECLTVAKHVLTNCPKLQLLGLMTIGAVRQESLEENPDFVKLNNLANNLSDQLGIKLEKSFGMSNDFELAIRQGSTNVRVGSLIFGDRVTK